MAILEIIIEYSLNNNKKNFHSTLMVKKYVSCQSPNISYNNNYNNDNIIYLNILKRQSHLNQLTQLISTHNYSISSSNNILSKILKECSNNIIDSDDIYRLTQQYPILMHLKTGQLLSCLIFNQKKLQCLIWNTSSQEIRIYNNQHTFFTEGIIKILTKSNDGLLYTILFIGKLNGTFIDSARALGLEENCLVDIINALQHQLDFRKLRQGDPFAVLVSSIVNSDNDLKSKLIGARLQTSGKDYYIFRATNGKIYNQEAIRLANNFICFPILQPYRISSNFNLNRLNPVTGQISPHAGVDFAVPVGTPVLSVGDGEVIISKYGKIAGNYVVIKHNYQCITRYMHLKKLLVKPGQKVKQGTKIALSGNTGRSTGPHLHFEVWINHHPVNPLTTNILNIEKLLGNERTKYFNQINEIIPKLSFN